MILNELAGKSPMPQKLLPRELPVKWRTMVSMPPPEPHYDLPLFPLNPLLNARLERVCLIGTH